MAEQILVDPNWHGERSAMIVEWPNDMELWEEYNSVRLESSGKMDGGKSACDFYEKHREALENGAKVSNEYRVRKGELTALHTAMNLYFEQGEKAFYSEYQNQPLSEFAAFELEPHMICACASGRPRMEIPHDCHLLTAMIDVNTSSGLHYTITAATNTMEVHIPYYGRYPEDVNKKLWSKENPGDLTEPQAAYTAIISVCEMLNKLKFIQNGNERKIDIISVDCGYLQDTVFKACAKADSLLRQTHVVASRGYAHSKWRETKVIGKPADNVYRSVFDGKGRVVKHNADYWRERVHQAFLIGAGAPGSISLYGKPESHDYFAEHICGERLLEHFQTEKDEYYNWQRVPGRKNDLLDSTVGAMALLSVLGASFEGGLKMNTAKADKKVVEATYTVL
jgi:hypothetical protein